MGLLGAYLAEVLLTWHKTNPTQRLIMLVQTVMWLTITMMFGLSKHVDTGAQYVSRAHLIVVIFSLNYYTVWVEH